MRLFGKKEEKKVVEEKPPELPELPKLPRFTDLDTNFNSTREELHKLPSFPSGEYGEKFSQDTIKEAVNGKDKFRGNNEDILKEKYEKTSENSFSKRLTHELPELPKHQKIEKNKMPEKQIKHHPINIKSRSIEAEEIPEPFVEAAHRLKKSDPVFIRIDKFQEAIDIFDKTKEKINEVEDLLKDIKKIKEHEEKELSHWENELQLMKDNIEKVDRDIFSKIE